MLKSSLFTSQLLALWTLLALVSCSRSEPMSTLTIRICQETDVPASVYPLQLMVSTETGVMRHDERIATPGFIAQLSLPSWARYHIVVRSSNNGYSAFCEYLLLDKPATLVLMLSADPEPSRGDTIHIYLEDPNTPSVNPEDSFLTPDVIRIEALPTPCSLWGDHLVAFIDSLSPNVSQLTLFSLYDWANLPSANHTNRSEEAATIALGYTEFGLSDWQIPTTDQAKRLRDTYGSNLPAHDSINALLARLDASEISLKTGNDNARYLCEDGHKTFSFASGTSIANAGTKATNYRLRLIRAIRVTTAK